jgi:raffinose/stachyose/melibiose transport system permease protein
MRLMPAADTGLCRFSSIVSAGKPAPLPDDTVGEIVSGVCIYQEYCPMANRKSGFQRRELTLSFISMIPATIIFAVVVLIPLILNLFFAFTDYNGLNPRFSYIGFDNFIKLLTKDTLFIESVGRTLVYSLLSMSLGIIMQFALALVLFKKVIWLEFFKAVFYVPSLLSMVIVSISWRGILRYGGILNSMLRDAGLERFAYDWLGDISFVLPVIVLISQWVYIGFGAMILLGGLNSIPQEVIESAKIDGASGLRMFFSITLPLIMHSVTVLFFMHITGSLTMFDIPFVMTSGGPRHATELISINIYNNAFVYSRVGYATAAALFFTIIVAFFGIFQLRFTRKREVEY